MQGHRSNTWRVASPAGLSRFDSQGYPCLPARVLGREGISP
jgi:hypothetical protein